ncbi:MAG: NAD(P)-dependent oxidoreductase [Methanobacteriota archaeon]|nr:MAG: NAD(P)-dependent oxidoreductase [Euryarchaeota archaeon]
MVYIVGASRLGKRIKRVVGGTLLSRHGGDIRVNYVREDFKIVLKKAKTVVFAAGNVSSNARELKKEHIEPIEELVDAISSSTKLIYASSISVYGKKIENIDDNSAINPDTPYARAKARAEEIALNHKKTVSMRLGVLYGEEYGQYMKMISAISSGYALIPGNGNGNIPFTHVGDVASFVKGLLKTDAYGAMNVAGKGCSLLQAIGTVERLLEKKAYHIHVPVAVGKLCDIVGCMFNSEVVASLSSNRKVESKKAEALGFKDRKIEEGIAEMVSCWKERRNRV